VLVPDPQARRKETEIRLCGFSGASDGGRSHWRRGRRKAGDATKGAGAAWEWKEVERGREGGREGGGEGDACVYTLRSIDSYEEKQQVEQEQEQEQEQKQQKLHHEQQ